MDRSEAPASREIQPAQERTVEEIKVEAQERAERGAYPLIGLDPAEVREALGHIKTRDPDEWAAAWSAVLDFAERMPPLFPACGEQLREYFFDPVLAETTAFRNNSLQGAYLIIAARALGLDCGPMSGFSNEAVDREFFADTRIRSNFICSIGCGSDQNLFPRNPRLTFEESGRFA
jgi:nitroreductase